MNGRKGSCHQQNKTGNDRAGQHATNDVALSECNGPRCQPHCLISNVGNKKAYCRKDYSPDQRDGNHDDTNGNCRIIRNRKRGIDAHREVGIRNFLERTSLTEFAKGRSPSIKICIILGVSTIVAAVLMATTITVGSGSAARRPIAAPMMKPMNIGSPAKPNFSWIPFGDALSLLRPGITSQSLLRAQATGAQTTEFEVGKLTPSSSKYSSTTGVVQSASLKVITASMADAVTARSGLCVTIQTRAPVKMKSF